MLKAYKYKRKIEAGCDEAGRGCLAGPVFAAAVILPKGFRLKALDDSKKLNESTRNELRVVIEKEALAWSVQSLRASQIDKINILNASFSAMHKAIKKLDQRPDLLLIDGNRFNPLKGYDFECIIKGDGIYQSIAAASILAKTHRDEYMKKLSNKYPQFGWESNKGYPTKYHREAIINNGPCKYHRKSFQLYPHPEQGKLFKP